MGLGLRLCNCVSHLQARITTRLQQYRAKAELSRNTRPQAWVPREKLPRPLTSSASAIRKLMRKAELMGISTDIFPVDTSDTSASMDGRRKHKQPALTADFVNYYLGKDSFICQCSFVSYSCITWVEMSLYYCFQTCTELSRFSAFAPEEVHVWTQMSELDVLQSLPAFSAWRPGVTSLLHTAAPNVEDLLLL